MALVKPPNPPKDNSTMISGAPPLSASLFAIVLPIGLALGHFAFPYVEHWLKAWLLETPVVKIDVSQTQESREMLVTMVETWAKKSMSKATLDSPSKSQDDTEKDTSDSEHDYVKYKTTYMLMTLAKTRKIFSETNEAVVAEHWNNLSVHQQKLATERDIRHDEWSTAYFTIEAINRMKILSQLTQKAESIASMVHGCNASSPVIRSESDTLASNADDSSEYTSSNFEKTSSDFLHVEAVPSIDVTADTSGTSNVGTVSAISTSPDPVPGIDYLGTYPSRNAKRNWSTAAHRGSVEELNVLEH